MMSTGFLFWYRYALYYLWHTILTCIKPSSDGLIQGMVCDMARGKAELIAENAFLRQQMLVLRRSISRPLPNQRDRLLLVLLANRVCTWQQALLIVQPDTLLRWHRELFRWVWRRKSKAVTCKPKLPLDTIALILRLVKENWLWGAERVRGELLKLGIRVSKRTIQRYMRRVHKPRTDGQTWATFLHNHAQAIWACDFVQSYDLLFRTIFIFLVIEHHSRRVVHIGVTRAPSDRWVAQQLREATAFGVAPKYLLHDNDSKYGSHFSLIASSTGIKELPIPPQSPNLNAICERFIGSLRRECLDHMLILNERQLHKLVKEYVVYFNHARPHQGIGQHPPDLSQVPSATTIGSLMVTAQPVLGGLHHDYRRAA